MSSELETGSARVAGGGEGRPRGVPRRMGAMLRWILGEEHDEAPFEPTPGVSARFLGIDSAAELDATFARSQQHPEWLFLNDPWCPISRRAYERLSRMDADFATVDVSRHRDLSKQVERRTGVRHESPQLILLLGGRPRWHASHGRIDPARAAREMQKAIGAGIGNEPPGPPRAVVAPE